jgi:CBS domain-containing protein
MTVLSTDAIEPDPRHPSCVGDVMRREPQTVDRNDKLLAADRLVDTKRIRHLPVLDEDGALVGIVSQRDLFHSGLLRATGYGSHGRTALLEAIRIKEVMTTQVITVRPSTPLKAAARLMLEHQIGCLPVMDESRLVGIITESDFVRLVLKGRC